MMEKGKRILCQVNLLHMAVIHKVVIANVQSLWTIHLNLQRYIVEADRLMRQLEMVSRLMKSWMLNKMDNIKNLMKFNDKKRKRVLVILCLCVIICFMAAPKNVISNSELDKVSSLKNDDIICYIQNLLVTKYTKTLRISIMNNGEEAFGYEPVPGLEKCLDGVWYEVPLRQLADEHTLDVPSAVGPGETATAEIYLGKEYPALSKGIYRLVLGESPVRTVYFEVR